MTISINQISNSIGLLINNDIFIVTEYSHVKPGKGTAFVRVKLKNVKTQQVLEKTFKTADKLDDVELEEKPLQYLYQSGDDYHFMDHSSYEDTVVTAEVLGDAVKFLLDDLDVTGLCYNGDILKVNLPIFITTEIIQTEPGFKGDSSKAGTKPAVIAAGTSIQVPLFIDIGNVVKVDTRTGQYVERVKR